jgi:hypothetical protein
MGRHLAQGSQYEKGRQTSGTDNRKERDPHNIDTRRNAVQMRHDGLYIVGYIRNIRSRSVILQQYRVIVRHFLAHGTELSVIKSSARYERQLNGRKNAQFLGYSGNTGKVVAVRVIWT